MYFGDSVIHLLLHCCYPMSLDNRYHLGDWPFQLEHFASIRLVPQESLYWTYTMNIFPKVHHLTSKMNVPMKIY